MNCACTHRKHLLEEGTMTCLQIEERCTRLREQYNLTDEQVIQSAENGTLPQNADHHTWLILLDRGDLILKHHNLRLKNTND